MTKRRPPLVCLIPLLLTGCAQGFVRTGPEDSGPRVPLETLASRLSLEISRDPLSRVQTLSDGTNIVILCPGMASVQVNDAVFPLSAPVLASSRGILVPEDARDLIRSRLRTPSQTQVPVPSTRRESAKPPVDPWRGARIPPLPRGWRVAANRRWTSIVIHHSATERGGAALFDKMHREENGWKYGLGYHFVIGNGTDTGDGEVEVGRRWIRQNEGIHGAHAGTDEYNQHGIGICLVGNFEEERPTRRQMAALLQLVRRLSGAYGISRSRIFEHQEVRPEHTDCPGLRFPFKSFLSQLKRSR